LIDSTFTFPLASADPVTDTVGSVDLLFLMASAALALPPASRANTLPSASSMPKAVVAWVAEQLIFSPLACAFAWQDESISFPFHESAKQSADATENNRANFVKCFKAISPFLEKSGSDARLYPVLKEQEGCRIW
jgi:hypothetical protein